MHALSSLLGWPPESDYYYANCTWCFTNGGLFYLPVPRDLVRFTHLLSAAIMQAIIVLLATVAFSVYAQDPAVGPLADIPNGVELRNQLEVASFLAHYDHPKCVGTQRSSRGFWFVPVNADEAGISFDQCEIGR